MIRITFCATSSLSPTVRVKFVEGAFILSAAVIGLIRKYLAITFDLKNLWFIIRVHLTNLTLDI